MQLEALLERCRQGDELAWEALVRQLQGRVYGLCRHYLRDPEEARDVAQDIFVRLYQRLDTFRGGETFLPWLLRLARNACIDRLRRIKSRSPAASVPVEDGPELPATGPSPEEQTEAEGRQRLVQRAIDRLSSKNREIIVLKDIQGLKLEEISEMLALPLGTVKSRSNRARIELARQVRALDPSYGV